MSYRLFKKAVVKDCFFCPAYPRGLYIDIRHFAGALKGFAYPRYAKRELARMRPGVFPRKLAADKIYPLTNIYSYVSCLDSVVALIKEWKAARNYVDEYNSFICGYGKKN